MYKYIIIEIISRGIDRESVCLILHVRVKGKSGC